MKINELINSIGKKVGRLSILDIVIEKDNRGIFRHNAWCKCDCGTLIKIAGCNLGRTTRSCGCYARDLLSLRNKTHGLSNSKIYHIWRGIHARCNNKNDKYYPLYGGRGIKVCKRWSKFENLLKDMGHPPSGTSLDRIDNNGPYSPKNCRWASQKQQCRNKRNNVTITYQNQTKCLSEWSEITGFSKAIILWRFRAGWNAEKILTQPLQIQRRTR